MPRLMRTKASKPALKVPKPLHDAKAYLIPGCMVVELPTAPIT
jgi:hypothetical protein